MPTINLPTSADLREVEMDLIPEMGEDDPILKVFPDENADAWELRWEQADKWKGMTNVRGLGGKPGRVIKRGSKLYMMEPGVYGDVDVLDEVEMTKRRRMATWGAPISIEDLIGQSMRYLVWRWMLRKRLILWNLALNGTFSVADKDGLVIATDSYTPASFTAVNAWSDHVNSTPIADLRSIQLKSRGHSVSFGPDSVLRLNRKWWNHVISNTNVNDLGGRRLQGLSPANSLAAVNQILLGEGLPTIEVFDGNYYAEGDDTSTAPTQFIPDSKALLVGKRAGSGVIGNFRHVMNINNENAAPGTYAKVIDRSEDTVPREIEVHYGANGGPTMYFPSALIVVNC